MCNYSETDCDDSEYGSGQVGDVSRTKCGEGQEGDKIARCLETGEWKLIEDRCILIEIKELLIVSEVGDSFCAEVAYDLLSASLQTIQISHGP